MFVALVEYFLAMCSSFMQLYRECLNIAWTMKMPYSPRRQKVTRTRFPSVRMEKKSVTQMAMPNPSQVPCAPRPNKDIPCSGNTALCCVVLKCLRQANTINTAEQCHALTLTIYLLKTSTPLTCVTIKRLTSAPRSFSAVKKS